jgi:hypothetical protein
MTTTPTTRRRPAKAAAAKKTTAKKTAAPIVRKAGPGVVLDLDALTKQQAMPGAKLPIRPFTFLLNGNDYELSDPRDTDWKLALELAANPFLLMRTCLVNADEPVDDPTEFEMRLCRERLGLVPDPVPDSAAAKEEAALYPDGIKPCVIDRWTAVDLPGWKLNCLFERWHEHYKIDLKDGKGILEALLGKKD